MKTVYFLHSDCTDRYEELAFASMTDVVMFFENRISEIKEILVRGDHFYVMYQNGAIEHIEIQRKILIKF